MKYLVLSIFFITILHEALCLEQSHVIPTTPFSSGLSTAGPIIQIATTPISQVDGLFWTEGLFNEKMSFIDRYNPAICRYTLDGLLDRLPLTEGKEASSIHPVKGGRNLQFVVGIDQSLYRVNVASNNSAYTATTIMDVDIDPTAELVKGKTDSKGRLWYTINTNNSGSIYKIQKGKSPQLMDSGFESPNGFDWTQDDKYFYISDTAAGVIYEYDYSSSQGTIKNRRIVFSKASQLSNVTGIITDIIADNKGNLWAGLALSGQLVKINPKTGKVLRMISIPASHISSLTFGGGLSFDRIFVGTSRDLLADPSTEPDAGAMFVVSGTGSNGWPKSNVNL